MNRNLTIFISASILGIILFFLFGLTQMEHPATVFLFPGVAFAMLFETTNAALSYLYNIIAVNILLFAIVYAYLGGVKLLNPKKQKIDVV